MARRVAWRRFFVYTETRSGYLVNMKMYRDVKAGLFRNLAVAGAAVICALGGMLRPAVAETCVPHWLPGAGAPGVDGSVFCSMMWDPDGAGPATPVLVIGGTFEYVGTTLCKNIACFDPQTGIWSALGSGVNGTVYEIVAQGGSLVVGGGFTAAGATSALGLAKWDGSSWSAYAGWSGTYAQVRALSVTAQNHLLVGGEFKTSSGLPGNAIARWNGTSWSTFGIGFGVTEHFAPAPSIDSIVVESNGNIVVGGTFDIAGGASIKDVARWNGSAWVGLGAGLNTSVNSLVLEPNGNIVAAGVFESSGAIPLANVARWNGAAWTPLGSGLAPVPGGSGAYGLTRLPNGDLVVTGNFVTAGGNPARGIARWDGSTWSAYGSGLYGNNSWAGFSAAELPNGDIVAGGRFLTADGKSASGLARWNGTEWSAFASGSDGVITALATLANGELVAGGNFTMIGGLPTGSIARWNGSSWQPLSSGVSRTNGMPGSIAALGVLSNGDIIAAGTFDAAGGVAALNVARWNGTTWSPMGDGFSSGPNALIVRQNGDIIAGGGFTKSGTTTLKYVAKWNGAGWVPYGQQLNGSTFAFAELPNGDLIAGGMFSTVGGVKYLAKWNGSDWENYAGNTLLWVHALAVAPNGDLIAGGNFTRVGSPSIVAPGIARWNGTQWASLGTGLDAAVGDAIVEAVTVLANGDIVAAGKISTAGGVAVNNIARWNGTSWSALDTGINDRGRALLPLASGGFVLGGNFSLAGGQPSKAFAMWTDDVVPGFAQSPEGQEACALASASFSATRMSGFDGTTIRWQLETAQGSGDFVDLGNGPIPGSGGAIAEISTTSPEASGVEISLATGLLDQRRVRAVNSNGCGELAGAPAMLSVCAADFNCDGMVNDEDFLKFAEAYDVLLCEDSAMPLDCPADINRDGFVDDLDFTRFVGAYDVLVCE